MNVLKLIDGNVECVSDTKDFYELIEQYMGTDAKAYIESTIPEDCGNAFIKIHNNMKRLENLLSLDEPLHVDEIRAVINSVQDIICDIL